MPDLAAPRIVQIAAHANHGCALFSDGEALCWGANHHGELGSGGYDETVAHVLYPLGPAAQIAVGESHVCARLRDGGAACVGDNYLGQLGDGTRNYTDVPVAVSGVTNATGISLGASFGCALTSDGATLTGSVCWGADQFGQLGTDSASDPLVAQPILGSIVFSQLALGDYFTCGLSDGHVYCWGDNAQNQLGDYRLPTGPTVTEVASLDGIAQIAAGARHVCALRNTGDIVCWGDNTHGQLGDGTIATRTAPVSVVGIDGATAITLGGTHGCALMRDGGVRCWGENLSGQNGDGTQLDRPFATTVIGLDQVTALALGDHHSCALRSDGSVQCWGDNTQGQIGDGTTTQRSAPVTLFIGH